jgi:molybdenum cofactor cytidylyltransferase
MIFGTMPLDGALGAILAHGMRHADGMFKKGRLLSAGDVAALKAAGHTHVVAARLQADDVPEDEAARQMARAICGAGALAQEPFTGRANLHASAHGIMMFDAARLNAVNHLHESLTIATLPNFARVSLRQMLATVKVIPFAVPRPVLEQALAIIGGEPLLRVAAFQPRKAALVLTRLPQTKETVLAKSEVVMRDRLKEMSAELARTVVCDHTQSAVAEAIRTVEAEGLSPILVMGASAVVDRGDVIPAAVVAAGGRVLHLGMPVDPGNLLMLGAIGSVPLIGVPSCARSPKVNGFDWVLERLVAGVEVSPSDIMDMGAGGLLAEIPSRPSPREGKGAVQVAPRVTAVVLAAGLSSRMGSNKLLADFHGRPLIAATLARLQESGVDEIIAVLGRDADDVAQHVPAGVRTVFNREFAEGISTSIRAGVTAAAGSDAVLIALGDMPLVSVQTVRRLIAAFNPTEHRSIIAPLYKGQFGNPVLWGAEHFPHLLTLSGDKGARSLIGALKSEAVELDVDDAGVLADADTTEALDALRKA